MYITIPVHFYSNSVNAVQLLNFDKKGMPERVASNVILYKQCRGGNSQISQHLFTVALFHLSQIPFKV